jgi:hypothetical protein
MEEVTFKGDKVLINAYFYTFWMPIKEFFKYMIDEYLLEKFKTINLSD